MHHPRSRTCSHPSPPPHVQSSHAPRPPEEQLPSQAALLGKRVLPQHLLRPVCMQQRLLCDQAPHHRGQRVWEREHVLEVAVLQPAQVAAMHLPRRGGSWGRGGGVGQGTGPASGGQFAHVVAVHLLGGVAATKGGGEAQVQAFGTK
eukprot:288058-Chlamydomonas_euryale.AAC.1